MYVVGNYVYQSNYSSGLQVLDLSDIANGNLTQTAYFDTYPANNNASYNGSWSNYPFYNSGVIAVSGIDEGLFILKPTLGTLARDKDEIEETVSMGGSVMQTVTVTNTGDLAFTFTASESAAWASVSPSGGALDPGQSMDLNITLDSSATAGSGTYTDSLSFSGTFYNTPADVDLILHVAEPSDYFSFIPIVANQTEAASAATAALPWLFPLLGLTAVAAIGRRKNK
jgi:hypothetical protein